MDYAGWNRALAARFFDNAVPEAPVYFAVNRVTLCEVCPDSDDPARAVADFEDAVRSQIYGNRPFSLVLEKAREWRRSGAHGDPPFLAALGATVLAVELMDRKSGSSLGGYSYYRPLRQVLGLVGTGIPEDYDTAMPVLWNHLAWWLDEHLSGKHGRSTAAAHGVKTNIGWALSQTVLAGSDRTLVGQYFSALGVSRDDDITEADLLAGFAEWLHTARARSKLTAVFASESKRTILGKVLVQELRSFDGSARDELGRSTLRLALTSANMGAPYGLAIQIPSGFHSRMLYFDHEEIPLRAGRGYVHLPLPKDTHVVLGERLDFSTPQLRLKLQSADCLIFQVDDALGSWVSVPRAVSGVDHRVLVRDSLAAEVESVLNAGGKDEVSRIRRAKLPSGWTGFAYYIPSQSVQAPQHLAMLAPDQREIATFDGGLRIGPTGQRVYLTGFAPDFVMPPRHDGTYPDVVCDGVPLPTTPSGEIWRFPLADIVSAPGHHSVNVGGRTLTFNVVDRYREREVKPSLCRSTTNGMISAALTRVLVSGSASSSTDLATGTWTCGAVLPESLRPVATAGRCRDGEHTPDTRGHANGVYDPLLTWCSEVGGGSYDAFRVTYEWLVGRQNPPKPLPWRIALLNMQILGHLEADDAAEYWSVTPAALCSFGDGGGYCLLVGQRPRWLQERITRLPDTDSYFFRTPIPQLGGPAVVLASTSGPVAAQELSEVLGVRFEQRPADRMVGALPGLADLLRSRGSTIVPPGIEPEVLERDKSGSWVQAPSVLPDRRAYRHRRFNGICYSYRLDGRYFRSDKRSILCAENYWRRSEGYILDPLNWCLYVPARAQLPLLHARAAVLRSGFLPKFEADLRIAGLPQRQFVMHANIDLAFAQQLADSLEQKLKILP